METTKNFQFKLHGRDISLTVPCISSMICTNKYCPQPLLSGGQNILCALNGETEEQFAADCQKQVIGMNMTDPHDSLIDTHVAGLMAVVMDHLSRWRRLIFSDLLIYMDVFSLLLEADGLPEEEIRDAYPKVLRSITDLYPDYIFVTSDLIPFRGSELDLTLRNLQLPQADLSA